MHGCQEQVLLQELARVPGCAVALARLWHSLDLSCCSQGDIPNRALTSPVPAEPF